MPSVWSKHVGDARAMDDVTKPLVAGTDRSYDVRLGAWDAKNLSWDFPLARVVDIDTVRIPGEHVTRDDWRLEPEGRVAWQRITRPPLTPEPMVLPPPAPESATVTIRMRRVDVSKPGGLSAPLASVLGAVVLLVGGIAGNLIEAFTATCSAALAECNDKGEARAKQIAELNKQITAHKVNIAGMLEIAELCKQSPSCP